MNDLFGGHALLCPPYFTTLLGDCVYTVRLQAEEWKDDKAEKGIKTLHLYNIYEYKKSSRFVQKDRLVKPTREDDNILSDNNNNINPSVNKHEDNGKTFFQKINKKGNASGQLGLFDGIMQLNLFKQ